MINQREKSIIPENLQILIDKYTNGYIPERQGGKPIRANPIPDYTTFVEYWLKRKSIRISTLRIYLSTLHKWNVKINEENIRDWNDTMVDINDSRHNYTMDINLYKRWLSSYEKKSSTSQAEDIQRFEYKMYIIMKMYFQATKQKHFIDLMPDLKEIKKPKHNIKLGYFTKEEFDKFIGSTEDKQYRLLSLLMLNTGARISELLHCRKNPHWFPIYIKHEYIVLQKGELFKITIPADFGKSGKGTLYINKSELITELIDYMNSLKDNEYLFKLHNELNTIKKYMDIEKEKNKFRDYISSTLHSAGLSHKIDEITPHSFRRSFIHWTYDTYDKDIKVTSELARHKTGVAMTEKYLELGTKEVENKLLEKFR